MNNESFRLKQLKERYYEPGLLSKLLGFNKEPLRSVSALQDVKLFPGVQTPAIDADGKLKLNLLNRGGGIGRVQVFVNDKELTADARGAKPNPQAKQATLNVDLVNSPALIAGKPNTVRVVTWNSEGYLSSRGMTLTYSPKTIAQAYKPQLWAIVGGTSEYSNPQLSLSFPSKDAEDMAKSFSLGARRLFGADKVHLTILSSSKNAGTVLPTKANFRKAFEAARKARPGDIIVIYLAGHGVALNQNNSTYCYLTQEARSTDTAVLSDPAVRDATTISSEELTEWIKKIPALKQVMILDTCAAGAAAKKLTEKRDISGDAVRAMERLKDRTGFFVLMGSAADAPSYEASQYQQGVLTYSLLQGLKGAALRDSSFVDVSKLFQYAADQVPQLARGIGGIQKPQIASPGGTSFDIGELQASDKALIPLATARPLVLRPLLINPEEVGDTLNLSALLAKKLRDQSSLASRGDFSSSVYIDADELAGAIQPKGTYSVAANKVVVHLALWRDGQKVDSLQVEGDSHDSALLVTKIADAINAALQKLPIADDKSSTRNP